MPPRVPQQCRPLGLEEGEVAGIHRGSTTAVFRFLAEQGLEYDDNFNFAKFGAGQRAGAGRPPPSGGVVPDPESKLIHRPERWSADKRRPTIPSTDGNCSAAAAASCKIFRGFGPAPTALVTSAPIVANKSGKRKTTLGWTRKVNPPP